MKANVSVNQVLGTLSVPSGSDWRAFLTLTKPTISLLVVVTVIPTLLLAANGLPDLVVAAAALFGTYLSSASAAVFNHLLDQDIDAQMGRTRARPVASGKVSQGTAFPAGRRTRNSLPGNSLWPNDSSCRCSGFCGKCLLRAGLYALSKTLHLTKYCNWWRSRFRWTFDWLGRHIWNHRMGSMGPFWHYLSLDTTTLLGFSLKI